MRTHQSSSTRSPAGGAAGGKEGVVGGIAALLPPITFGLRRGKPKLYVVYGHCDSRVNRIYFCTWTEIIHLATNQPGGEGEGFLIGELAEAEALHRAKGGSSMVVYNTVLSGPIA